MDEDNSPSYEEPEWYRKGYRMIQEEWRLDAKCLTDSSMQDFLRTPRGRDFFHSSKYTINATLYCESCPVLMDCRRHAAQFDEDGVWGGMTRNSRTRWKHSFEAKLQRFQEQMQAQLQDIDTPIVEEADEHNQTQSQSA